MRKNVKIIVGVVVLILVLVVGSFVGLIINRPTTINLGDMYQRKVLGE